MESLEIAKISAHTAHDVKAENVLLLDVRELTTVCDYMVIASAPTRVQTKDIARKVEQALLAAGETKSRIQGRDEASWILLDYGMVVVHVFLTQEREFYDLEGRWSEAEVLYDSGSLSVRS
ncbi:MAG: ribosome silencing factor [Vulcanimicrobiota bacterium]